MTERIRKIIYMIFLFFTGLFIISSFFLRAEYSYPVYGDSAILNKQNPGVFLLLICLLGILSLGIYKLCLRLNQYSKKIVIPAILLLSFGLQAAVIFLLPAIPNADSETVLKLAKNILYNKDYSSFQTGGYLYAFPYNFSIVLYLEALLAVFPDSYLVIKTFNILFSLATAFLIYLIFKEIRNRPKDKEEYGVLVFAALYLPSLFMCNYIYNDIIATAFFTGAIYFMIRFVKAGSLKYILASSILLSLGNYFRGVGILILIAAVIYVLLNKKKLGWKRIVGGVCIAVALFQIPAWVQDTVLLKTNIISESTDKNSAPVSMWLNIGINLKRFGFWDNRESYRIYQTKANYNKEKSDELFKEEIRNKISSASFYELTQMYYKKVLWTWTEGTYQVDKYGIGNDASGNNKRKTGQSNIGGSYCYTTFATDLLKGKSVYRSALLWVMYVMNFLMYCFIFIRLVGGIKRKRPDEVFLVLIILGFIGFYLLWEIKSRYIYPVYPLLILLSFLGYRDAFEHIQKLGGKP